MTQYIAESKLPVSSKQAFAYHECPGALERLIPPWQNVQVENSDSTLSVGSSVVLRIKRGPVSLRWVAEHTEYDPPHLFTDIQRSGPFASWRHRHRILGVGDSECVLRDEIDYQLPVESLSGLAIGSKIRRDIESMFAYRHRITLDDLTLISRIGAEPMTIAVSGSTGLIGRSLCAFLKLAGHRVIHLERSIERCQGATDRVAPWESPEEANKLSGVDAVVHLAGKPIAGRRWTDQLKNEIRDSRVIKTRELAASLARLSDPPKVLVCASAIGIYGDRGDELLDESSEIGSGFLPNVADQWEQSCRAARDAGIRVANARMGIVLDRGGGALEKMLTPAKFCGGALGKGTQWWSWVALDDAVGAIYHAICVPEMIGPFNVTAPTAVRNKEFAATLGRVLSRPALFPAPAFALRAALGEMADALLLQSTRVRPGRLESTGYGFRFSQVEEALRYCLGVDRKQSA